MTGISRSSTIIIIKMNESEQVCCVRVIYTLLMHSPWYDLNPAFLMVHIKFETIHL